MLKVKMTCLAASLALHLENRWTLISASFLIINNSYVLTSYICTVFCEYVRILLQQVLLKSFKCDPSPLQLRARQMLSHQKPNRRKTWTQYITPCHPDVSSTSVRVREKGNTDKSLKPANEISQGHQKWSGRWGSFQSGRISFGLYCLAQTLQGEVKQPQHVKASKTAFFFSPSAPSDFTPRPWLICCWMVLSQCVPLKCRELLWLPPVPPSNTVGLNCVWPLWGIMAEGLSFFWPSQCSEEGLLYTVFSCGVSVIHRQGNRLICAKPVWLFTTSDFRLLKLQFIGQTNYKISKKKRNVLMWPYFGATQFCCLTALS